MPKEANAKQGRRAGGRSNPRPPATAASDSPKARLFQAEMAYADSMVRQAIGDHAGMIAALERSLEAMPTYAPAILSVGSIEYQRKRIARGRGLFLSLTDLPNDTPDLHEIIDEAGDFLIGIDEHEDGLELYRRAAARFPEVAVFHQGLACCAGNLGHHPEAISASETALTLEPDNQKLVNDLGWSLFEAGRLAEARPVLERAVAMDPTDKRAAENLRICREAIEKCSGPASAR